MLILRILLIVLCLVAIVFVIVLWRAEKVRWFVYYGAHLKEQDLSGIKLAILEPDHISPHDFKKAKTQFFGYLSVGEVSQTRPYWKRLQTLEPNPDWPGATRMDIRSEAWRHLILDEIIPSILDKGYQGVFLDTVDTAIYLEDRDQEKFIGSKRSLISLIRAMKERYPKMKILINNGLEILPHVADVIDGVVVEDLYTRHNFKTLMSEPTPQEVVNFKEPMLDDFKKNFHKPVYNILYGTALDSELVHSAIKRSREKGYHWHLTTVNLDQISPYSQ